MFFLVMLVFRNIILLLLELFFFFMFYRMFLVFFIFFWDVSYFGDFGIFLKISKIMIDGRIEIIVKVC